MNDLLHWDELLAFWFSPDSQQRWFNSTEQFDRELKERYQTLYELAVEGGLSHWQQSALGSLGLVILFDQIPLNIFRGQKQSFATEAKSRQVAEQAIANHWDEELTDKQKMFLYMPYMHSENIYDQDRSVELFEQAGLSNNLRFAIHHRDIIRRFGRFPHRNAVLGRTSTQQEIDYLDSDEAFHG